jgi:anti-sigma-K factor RskA
MKAEVHTLAGAYALDALPANDTAAFTHHLRACGTCSQEVAELEVTAAHLGLAAATTPPAGLRARVLRAADQTRQAPPASLNGAGAHRRSVWRRRLPAAAAAVLILLTGLLTLRPDDDLPAPPQQEQILAVMQAPDMRSSTASLRGGGSMNVMSSRGLDQAVVLDDRWPRLDPAHDYQLWLIDRAGNPRPAHVLIDGTGQPSGPHLVNGLNPGDHLAITAEPDGGSPRPTTAPLASTNRT